ncbi:MAG: F0F1 ATP synthase subunit B [Cellulophaga sp.]|uniref:F0F1 ATP synthase subunit B n=1 Tax=unclassified Cellulophaga TaxID=2634405 RepID=UPI000C2BDD1C|nr:MULTISPECIES: F0F1 ATP synthase subunit B [unclassified Cellulophaga]MDO6489792.1 F0F1 ATP synthase subunit B [Cellulophaga sp. 2_MG-2023]MDO6495014.1 F0F1 ATP synthase subunit B [Cellulophaga sp. 3_MG-2023]PKB42578.1 ATP synthase F0 subcomplex B subunit [Cellulophaga sp. RHA19]|eukprot:TRINITY_DN5076_c0_g2_i1.p1 TRINITY_DN5076_c0_g2~~TRINITY_DN5076_c0_g2_i1.p1  ORF type:complete len:167 (-),score=16.17 TRINITY_DN5076_c0_g2_i1:69-569(-)
MDQLLNDFSPGLFFMLLIILLVLIFLMVKFAWKPIMNSLNEREDGIKSALEEAENARKEMQNLHADNERLLQEARAERDAMLKEAREIKEKIVADAKEQSIIEGDKLIAQAKATIDSEKKAAVADIKNQVANLSVQIAEKVIKEQLSNNDKQLKLVEDMVGDIKLN